jgi:hypothetical protein
MRNFPLSQIQNGVILIVRNLVPDKMKLSKADGVYLCQLNEVVTITITSLVAEIEVTYEYVLDEMTDVGNTRIGTLNPCTGYYSVNIGDVTTVSLTMNDHKIVQVDDNA